MYVSTKKAHLQGFFGFQQKRDAYKVARQRTVYHQITVYWFLNLVIV